MKTKLSVVIRSLLPMLIYPLPVAAHSSERMEGGPKFGTTGLPSWPKSVAQGERSNRFFAGPRTVSADYLRFRINQLDSRDPRHIGARAYLFTLLDTGCDPTLLNLWLSALDEGVILDGMPGQLVLEYFGEPLARESIDLHGATADRWSLELKPGQVDRVTILDGRVVADRG